MLLALFLIQGPAWGVACILRSHWVCRARVPVGGWTSFLLPRVGGHPLLWSRFHCCCHRSLNRQGNS